MGEKYNTFLEISKVALALLGGIYVALQYDEGIKREEAKHAQEFVSRYDSQDIAASRIRISSFLLREREDFGFASNYPRHFVAKDPNLFDDFLRIHYFFNDVSTCGRDKTCNAQMLCSSFSRDIEAWRRANRTLYLWWKEQWAEDLLVNIDQFMEGHCQCNLAEYYCLHQPSGSLCERYTQACLPSARLPKVGPLDYYRSIDRAARQRSGQDSITAP